MLSAPSSSPGVEEKESNCNSLTSISCCHRMTRLEFPQVESKYRIFMECSNWLNVTLIREDKKEELSRFITSLQMIIVSNDYLSPYVPFLLIRKDFFSLFRTFRDHSNHSFLLFFAHKFNSLPWGSIVCIVDSYLASLLTMFSGEDDVRLPSFPK